MRPVTRPKSLPAVLARACVGKPLVRRFAKSKCVIEFAIREQTCIRGNDGTPKENHQPPFKSGRKTPFFASPVGFFNSTASHQRESLVNYTNSLVDGIKFAISSGECGLRAFITQPGDGVSGSGSPPSFCRAYVMKDDLEAVQKFPKNFMISRGKIVVLTPVFK